MPNVQRPLAAAILACFALASASAIAQSSSTQTPASSTSSSPKAGPATKNSDMPSQGKSSSTPGATGGSTSGGSTSTATGATGSNTTGTGVTGSGTSATSKAAASGSGPVAGSGKVSGGDKTFMMHAAQGGMAEVEGGKAAQSKASSDAVKQFAQRMVTDHGKANDELMSLARSKGVDLPTTIDAAHKKDVDKMSSLSGAEFDKAYMKHMVADHKKDVAEFEKTSRGASDPDVKAFAAKTLPTLQEHLKMAEDVNNQVQKGGNAKK